MSTSGINSDAKSKIKKSIKSLAGLKFENIKAKPQSELAKYKTDIMVELKDIKSIYIQQNFVENDSIQKKINTIIFKDKILKHFVNLSIVYIKILVEYSKNQGKELSDIKKELTENQKRLEELERVAKNSSSAQVEYRKIIDSIKTIAEKFIKTSDDEANGANIKAFVMAMDSLAEKEKINSNEINDLNNELYRLIEEENKKLFDQINEAPLLVNKSEKLNNAITEPNYQLIEEGNGARNSSENNSFKNAESGDDEINVSGSEDEKRGAKRK